MSLTQVLMGKLTEYLDFLARDPSTDRIPRYSFINVPERQSIRRWRYKKEPIPFSWRRGRNYYHIQIFILHSIEINGLCKKPPGINSFYVDISALKAELAFRHHNRRGAWKTAQKAILRMQNEIFLDAMGIILRCESVDQAIHKIHTRKMKYIVMGQQKFIT